MEDTMSEKRNIIIIGGGVIGLSLAYHLAKKGARDILLLERNQMTSGTTWHAAGIVGPLRSTFNMTKLAAKALQTFPELERETGLATGYMQTSGYWIARRAERMDELYRIHAMAGFTGMTPEMLSGEEVAARVPGISAEGIHGALTLKEDGQVNPVDLTMAFAKGARSRGVEIREGISVASLIQEDGRVTGVELADGTRVEANQVALCAGAWSKKLADEAGIVLPQHSVKHMYVVTEPIEGFPKPFPVFRDMETHVYMKGDAGKLLVGWFEMDAKSWDPYGAEGDRPFLEMEDDWEQAEPFIEAALRMYPGLESAGIQHFLNGPESFTADSRPLVGETPELQGLFVATGLNSVGIMSSAGVGDALADWMIDGDAPSDLWDIDILRGDPLQSGQAYMEDKMREAVGNNFAMHWPFKQPVSGRDLRRSPLHQRLDQAGAVWGVGGAWERTRWFAQDEAEKNLPYSVGPQSWQYVADREAQNMAADVVLIDLSMFTKINVSGPDALALLQWVSTAHVDVAEGRAVYTAWLNQRGGVEADLTVTRLGSNLFRVTSGAATRRKDLYWLQKQARIKGFDVTLQDVTESEAVIGVMGPRARALLQDLSDDNWQEFDFSTARRVTVAGIECSATRISFVGELGWEIAMPAVQAPVLFDAFRAEGAGLLGIHALDGCRIEKGFKHWGHDLGPDISPLEAGIGFAVNWTKGDFLGRIALAKQKQDGLTRRQLLLEVEGEALLLHDEPVWERDKRVGLTSSGARGPRTGKNLCFANVAIAPGETLAETRSRCFEIEVADRRYKARPLTRVPYDPDNGKMNG
ncbi:putative oxidoreductase protein [Roseobacter sp. SK209-2-6]|uniref:GcvT family protein n=1 Tax=Roseobacter sp. SK209-2-6 TaxID=388739 RepID=UPI0000F3F4FC|nr:FAD-dependent oxidoreductase [Roseobacter sp. SK209-2-6]EBA14757.1 putative oxidoreductase protein [Roseobacter sp. SK209-2-6]